GPDRWRRGCDVPALCAAAAAGFSARARPAGPVARALLLWRRRLSAVRRTGARGGRGQGPAPRGGGTMDQCAEPATAVHGAGPAVGAMADASPRQRVPNVGFARAGSICAEQLDRIAVTGD